MKIIVSIYLFFSSGNISFSCYMDGYENFFSVILGIKEILVVDLKYVEYFYFWNYIIVNIEFFIDFEVVDLQKFFKFVEIFFYKVG